MFDWKAAIFAVAKNCDCLFQNEGYVGSCSYEDSRIGTVEFSYSGNKTKVVITYQIAEPVCFCETDTCDCASEFYWNEPEINYKRDRVFSKAQWERELADRQLSLFS